MAGSIFLSTALLGIAGAWPGTALAEANSWSDLYAAGQSSIKTEKPSQAVAKFRQALSIVRKGSRDPADLDKCRLALAQALSLDGKVSESRSLLLKMLSEVKANDGAGAKRMNPVLMALGSIEEAAGNHESAMSYYNQALAINERQYGPYSPEAAKALYGVGRTNHKSGKKDAAVLSYKKAISILSKDPNQDAAEELKSVLKDYKDLIKGDDDSDKSLLNDYQKDILKNDSSTKEHYDWNEKESSGRIKISSERTTGEAGSQAAGPASAAGSQFQAASQRKLQDSRAAASSEDEQVALRQLSVPSSDATLRPAFKTLTDTIVEQPRYKAAESQYERMIATDINSLGPHHPSVANDMNGLAQLYISQSRFSEARNLLIKALAVYEAAYGERNTLTINTRAALASCEAALGNFTQALESYNKALAGAQEILGPDSFETAKILNALAYLYFTQGQLEKSSTVYEWALASTERSVGKNDPRLAACMKDYAQVLRRLDKNEKAQDLESRALQIIGR